MSDYTIVDSTGEILKYINVGTPDEVIANTPINCQAISGKPDNSNFYRVSDEWISKGTPTVFGTWNVDSKTWVDLRTLDEVKTLQTALIKAARDTVVNAGFLWDSSKFDSDPVAQGRIGNYFGLASNATTASAVFPVTWILFDNTTRSLSAADMINVAIAFAAMGQAAFGVADGLCNQINAASDIASVEAIVWPAS